MVHTARLGIPVIELIKPVYVWIGLPLALVIFSGRWLFAFVAKNVKTFQQEIESIKREIPQILGDDVDKATVTVHLVPS